MPLYAYNLLIFSDYKIVRLRHYEGRILVMKTLTFITQKGGAGKTTLAASLAVAAQEAGEKVAVLDCDPQQSLMGWADNRKAESPAVDTLGTDLIARMPEILKQLAGEGYTLTILDTAGVDTTHARLAMENADLCVIPTRPSTADIRATKITYEAAVRSEKPYVFVLNQCPPQPNSPRANEAAAGLRMWGLMAEPLILQRAAQQDAFTASLGVTEYEPEGRAADEIRQLWQCLKQDMEGQENGRKKKLVG